MFSLVQDDYLLLLQVCYSPLQVKRTLGQFTPAQWDKDEWHPLLGPWRFIQVISLCIIFLTVELNTFFLKFCLWVPPRNPVIIYRLILWWLIAIPTIREYNSYLQDRYSPHLCPPEFLFLQTNPFVLTNNMYSRKPVKKVGAFCWLSLAICIIELLICIKFGHGTYFEIFCTYNGLVSSLLKFY